MERENKREGKKKREGKQNDKILGKEHTDRDIYIKREFGVFYLIFI